MVRNNHVISKNHFKKNWKDHVKLKFDEKFRKHRRNIKRQKKAMKIAPRPANQIRPLVQCPTIRYNTKARYGRGFTLAEIKTAGLNKQFAKTIGISVDHRRRDKSYEVLQRNVQRLKEYLSKLVLYPKNVKKIAQYESSIENYKKCGQIMGKIMPKMKPKMHAKAMALSMVPEMSVIEALRLAKASTKRKPKKKEKKPRVTFE